MLSHEIKRVRGPMSQRAFAAKVGISPGTIGAVESGNVVLGEAKLHQIADALDLADSDRAALLNARDLDMGVTLDRSEVQRFASEVVDRYGADGAVAILGAALADLRGRPTVSPRQRTMEQELEEIEADRRIKDRRRAPRRSAGESSAG